MKVEKRFSPLGLLLGTAWALGAFALISAPFSGAGAAWAQDDGHDDGGHDDGGDGGHDDGGHDDGGSGGKGKKHGKPVPPPALPVALDSGSNSPVKGAGADLPGTYFRFELGAARSGAGNANWLPPGYPSDPQVFFDLDLDSAVFGGAAVGHNYGNGWRAEAALNVFGSSDFTGSWSYTVPADPGPHADMSGSVRSIALMANGYYDFDTGGKAVPFVTAGLGLARNTMADWTRINPDADRTTRSFEGGSETSLAWSIGVGVAVDIGPVLGSAPAKLELAWRHFDLGSASGGYVPLPGSGAGGEPVAPLNFDVTNQVISLGLRIPL